MRFTKNTIRASFLVENPDWYVYYISKLQKKRAADGNSDNLIYILEGKSGEMDGVPVSKLISEKADWILYPLFKAANGGKDLSEESDVNPEDLVGITLEGFTRRGQRQDGTPMNDITDWAPLGTNTGTK